MGTGTILFLFGSTLKHLKKGADLSKIGIQFAILSDQIVEIDVPGLDCLFLLGIYRRHQKDSKDQKHHGQGHGRHDACLKGEMGAISSEE
jgi:hypothetical protein